MAAGAGCWDFYHIASLDLAADGFGIGAEVAFFGIESRIRLDSISGCSKSTKTRDDERFFYMV